MPHFRRFVLGLTLCNLLCLHAFAAVTVTTTLTSGTNISADKSAGSAAAAFTPLTNIVITSALATDFTANQTNVTIILTAPASWQFQAGTGSAVGGGNVTVSSTVVTGTTVTITYSTGANSISNSLTISGLQVQGTVKTIITSANITRTTSTNPGTIAGFSVSTSTSVGALSQVAGAFNKLQLLLPGEVAAAGTASGKTGTPNAQAAGTAFNVTVNAVDANWNKVTTITDLVGITSTDANGTMPTSAALASGTKNNFSVTLKTLGTATITATDAAAGTTATPSTSPSVTVIVGAFVKLQLLLPGETAAPGTTTGKSGTPTPPVAGTAYNVTVNAVDAAWNVVSSATDVVHIASTDVNAALPGDAALITGTQTLSITLKTAISRTITASDVTTPAKTANTSPAVIVANAGFSKLQLLMPGETAAAGTATGKTGTPNALNAGTAFNVIINAVDAYWNKVNTITDVVAITTNDPLGIPPGNTALVAGTKSLSVNLKSPATTAVVTATDATDGSKTACVSPNTVVNIGTFVKLQLLLPGETAAPGTTTGKTGTPVGQTAGSSFNVIINAVDAAWNVVSSVTDVVGLVSTDVNAILPANTTLAAGTQTLNFTFKTSGSKTITASDITVPAKTTSKSPTVIVSAGTFVKLQLLLPGEVTAAGTTSGKTGTPTPQNAGTAFNVTVNAVDANWNKVTTIIDLVDITSTDASGVMPVDAALGAGTKTNFAVNLKTPGTAIITATDVASGTTAIPCTSPSVTVNIGGFSKLQLLLPGETATPGTTTGKTGTPTAPVAGTAFNVIVNAVDAAWNLVTSANDVISITSSDVNAALPSNTALTAGTQTLSVTLKTAGSRTVTASDITNGARSTNVSPAVIVAPNTYSQLQVLLPGETAVAGTTTGKIGTANPPTRGTAFNVIINAVDANFNKVTSVINTVAITSSDGTAILPAAAALVAGTKTFTGVKIVSTSTAPLPTITATDATAAISSTVDVPLGIPPTLITDYFRTQTSGNWNDANTWQSSTDGINGWQDATLAPTSASNTITILNGNVVTVTASVTVDQVTIQTGGQVIVNSGQNLTIASGGTSGADVSGILTNAGTITPTGTLTFLSGGKYQHNTLALGTIPTATWNNLSICEIIGYTNITGTVGGGNQTFGNLIWNCPGQNNPGAGVSLGGNASVNDLTVLSTGIGNFQLATAGGTITVRGNFSQSGGNLVLDNTTTGTTNFNIAGNFTLSGGTISKGAGANLISFNGSTTQTYLKTGGAFSGAVNFAINTGSTVDFGTSVVDGSTGLFTVNTGATLITGNDNGLGATGTIQTGTHSFSSTANYTYNGTNAQNIGSGLPTSFNNLTVDNTQSITLPAGAATYTVSGQITLTNGNLDMGSNILAAGAGFAIGGTGVLRTQSVATTPIPSGKTWPVEVEYYGASAQNVVPGTYSNLTFSSSGTKTASGTITVNGNWSSSDGKVDLSNATVVFGGTTQTFNDDGTDNGNGIVFKNVTFGNSGTKTLSTGSYSVAPLGLLTMSGTATLAANGNLTLISDATGTGSIGQLTGNNPITGNVNVQTFVTGGNLNYRGYRLLTSSISDPSSGNAYYNMSYLKGSGSFLSGAGGATNGFDVSGNPTLYLYREDQIPAASLTTGNYWAITAINNSPAYSVGTIDGAFNLPVGTGYLFFFRGNPSTNATTPPDNIVFSTAGTINHGQITVKPWFNGSGNLAYSNVSGGAVNGFNLVGNPYPSSIDWNKEYNNNTTTTGICCAANLSSSIYIYNVTTKNYSVYTNTGVGAGIASGSPGGSNIIPSGQGFFVQANNASAQLIFNESAKVLAQPGTLLLNASAPVVDSHLRLQLSKDTINKDETVLVFNNAAHTTYLKNEDALYLKGSGLLSLSNLSADNSLLAINQLPFPEKTQTISLNVTATTKGTYQLNMTEMINIPNVYDIWLMDAFAKDSLDIKHNPGYSFNITADAASSGNKRFSLVIRQDPARNVHLLSFTGSKDVAGVKLLWTVENEANYTHFALEKSTDGGKTFIVLDSLTSASLGTYTDLDVKPAMGQNLYRLKQVDVMGNVSYSNAITVLYGNTASIANNIAGDISIYPNPAKSIINLAIKQGGSGQAAYKINITNNIGMVVKTGTSAQADWQTDVSTLLPGTYFVEVINTKTNSLTGRSTFIKL